MSLVDVSRHLLIIDARIIDYRLEGGDQRAFRDILG